MICCNTIGKPQIPSKLGTVGLTLTPEKTDMDLKKEKKNQINDHHIAIDDKRSTLSSKLDP